MENHNTNATAWEELQISNDFIFGKIMQDSKLCKELLQRILPELKIDHKTWRHEYMTLLMRDQENREIGEKYGENKMAKLIMLLNEDGRLSDIVRVSQNLT